MRTDSNHCPTTVQPFIFRESAPASIDATDRLEDSAIGEKKSGKPLYCSVCRQKITTESQRIAMGGKMEHTFFNPHGVVFRIGCFNAAQGCGTVGAPAADFSWFPGYRWQIIYCTNCKNHLGWLFSRNTNNRFFGLILSQLTHRPG